MLGLPFGVTPREARARGPCSAFRRSSSSMRATAQHVGTDVLALH